MANTPGLLDGVKLNADIGEQFQLSQVMSALRTTDQRDWQRDEEKYRYLVAAFTQVILQLIKSVQKIAFSRKVRLPRGHTLVLGTEGRPGTVKLFIGPGSWGYPGAPRSHETPENSVKYGEPEVLAEYFRTYEDRIALQLAEGIVGSCIPRLGRAYQILQAAKRWVEMQQAQSAAVSEGSAVQPVARGPYR